MNIVIVESSLIFIRGCNSLKLCLYFPENAPGTRNKISRKRDLWSPNMTHSDLNLLAWCYVANQNTNRRNLDKTQNTHSSIKPMGMTALSWWQWWKMNRLRGIEWLSVYQGCIHYGVSASPAIIVFVVPLYLGNSAWQPGSQSLFTAFRLFICFALIWSDLSFSHSRVLSWQQQKAVPAFINNPLKSYSFLIVIGKQFQLRCNS